MLMSGDSINMALWGGDVARIMAYIGNEQEEPPEGVWRLVCRHKLLSELQLDDMRHGCMSLNEGKRFEKPCKAAVQEV